MQNAEKTGTPAPSAGDANERAKLIVQSMIRVVASQHGVPGDPPDLEFLKTLSLAEMVEANAFFKNHDGNPRVEGNTTIRTIQMHCDDRLTAAMYAMLHFPADDPNDADPILMMEVDGKLHMLIQVFADKPTESDDGR